MAIKKHKKLILLALLIALPIMAIALLPWWLPENIVKEKIASDLSQQLHRNVQIEHIQLSWSKGVTIQNLRIDRSPDFGTGQLLTISQANCQFNLKDLIARKIKRLNVQQADIYIVINKDGRINIKELPQANDITIENIALRQTQVHLIYPRKDNSQGKILFQTEALIKRSEERRVGKSVDLGGRRIIKKKKKT